MLLSKILGLIYSFTGKTIPVSLLLKRALELARENEEKAMANEEKAKANEEKARLSEEEAKKSAAEALVTKLPTSLCLDLPSGHIGN